MKATVENPRDSVEKLSPKESVEGATTVLWSSVSEGFSKGKPEAAKSRGRSHQCFSAQGLPRENPEEALTLPRSRGDPLDTIRYSKNIIAQCRHPRHSSEGAVIPLCPKDFQQLLRLPSS